MADHCCDHDEHACDGRQPVVHPAREARAGLTCGDACCSGGVPVFDGVDPRYRRILWTVIAINGAMFLTEMVAGQLAGSQALKADALSTSWATR